MNHFYTKKSIFFRNSRFVFQEAPEGRKVEAQNLKDKPEGEPIKGNESPTTLAFKEARAGKDAIGNGGNELLALQGPEGLKNAIDAAKKNPVDAFYKLREGMHPKLLEAIAEQLAIKEPNIFLANARFFEKTNGYSANLEKAVTNPKLSPDYAVAFASAFKNQPYANAVIAKAADNLKNTDPRTLLSYASLFKGKEYGKVLADAEKRDPIGANRYV
jgi:hypothetical protein